LRWRREMHGSVEFSTTERGQKFPQRNVSTDGCARISSRQLTHIGDSSAEPSCVPASRRSSVVVRKALSSCRHRNVRGSEGGGGGGATTHSLRFHRPPAFPEREKPSGKSPRKGGMGSDQSCPTPGLTHGRIWPGGAPGFYRRDVRRPPGPALSTAGPAVVGRLSVAHVRSTVRAAVTRQLLFSRERLSGGCGGCTRSARAAAVAAPPSGGPADGHCTRSKVPFEPLGERRMCSRRTAACLRLRVHVHVQAQN
jgi:hypothetical protein